MFKQFRLILTRHYFDPRGRVGRAEFWYFVLAAALVYGTVTGAALLFSLAAHRLTPLMNCVNAFVALALLPPLAGMGARRLRDVGQNGLLVWTLIVPLAIVQVSSLLAREPFPIPSSIYDFYWAHGGQIDFVALLALVALTSFWMQPGGTRSDAPEDQSAARSDWVARSN